MGLVECTHFFRGIKLSLPECDDLLVLILTLTVMFRADIDFLEDSACQYTPLKQT